MGPQIQFYKQLVSVTVRRVLRRLRAALLVLVGLFVLYGVLYGSYTTWRLRQVRQGWASSFESMESFAARFPKTATSSGARRLHELTQPLGIDMVRETAKSDRLTAIVRFADAQGLMADDATLNMAGYSEQVRITTELLRDRDDPCSLDLQAVSRAGEDALPRWNGARSSIENLPRAWGAMTFIRLDGELTRLVIEARRNSRDIVHANASPLVSAVCKGVSWIQTSSGDGRVTIAAKPARPFRDENRRDWTFSFGPTS